MIRFTAFIALFVIFASLWASANIVGTDANNFNSNTSGLDFVTVQSSRTLEPGIYNLGLFSTYYENSLSFLSPTTKSGDTYRDGLWVAETNLGVGFGRRWDFGLSLPFLVSSASNAQNQRILISGSGLMGIRANIKYRPFGDNDGSGLALIASANQDLLGNNPYSGTNPGPTAQLEMAYSTWLGRFIVGVNGGYRLRYPGTPVAGVPINPFRNQWIGSLAASYMLKDFDTKLVGEIFGSTAAQAVQNYTDQGQDTLEWIVGAKHDFTTKFSGHIGGGSRIGSGTSSPDWRAYVGFNYAWGAPPVQVVVQAPAPPPEPIQNLILDTDTFFNFDSDQINELTDISTLNLLAEQLKTKGFQRVSVEGHTDSIGPADYNLKLSQRRAETVKKYLISKGGVTLRKVDAQGFGEEKPIDDNSNYQGRQRNRRVEIHVVW